MENKFDNSALIIIDVQKGFDFVDYWGKRNNPQAEENIAKLISHWRETNRKIIFIQHMSKNPKSTLYVGQVGNEYKEIVAPKKDDVLFHKSVHSAFIGTKLEDYLRENNIKKVVITGIATNFCVSTTARMAGDLGFETYVVNDGTACFDKKDFDGSIVPAETVHKVSLANIHQEFASIVNTNDLLK